MLTIGKLALSADVTTDTIRFYEKQKLLIPARKSDAGYRLYDAGAVQRLRFIKQAQSCGFSLAEIGDLLAVRNRDAACCQDIRHVAIEKKLQLEHRIKTLRAMSDALSALINVCDDGAKSLEACPIIAALENGINQNITGERHD
jgi:DNA-binding transcriptional MerR regulator